MRDCPHRVPECTHVERSRFDRSRLVQDAVVGNLQTLTDRFTENPEAATTTGPAINGRQTPATALKAPDAHVA
jgi:hypothetical protein